MAAGERTGSPTREIHASIEASNPPGRSPERDQGGSDTSRNLFSAPEFTLTQALDPLSHGFPWHSDGLVGGQCSNYGHFMITPPGRRPRLDPPTDNPRIADSSVNCALLKGHPSSASPCDAASAKGELQSWHHLMQAAVAASSDQQ